MDVIQEIIVYFISGRKSGIDITQIFPEEGKLFKPTHSSRK